MGVRRALGAQPADIMRLVLGEGLRTGLLGIVIGVLSALALTRIMRNLLYGVSAADPFTFLVVSAVLICVTLTSCFIPARRATHVDPMTALRYE